MRKPVDYKKAREKRGKPLDGWRDSTHVVVIPVPKAGKILAMKRRKSPAERK